jgi:hypothetical protein
LASALVGYAELGQARWSAWLRKQRLETTIPTEFAVVLDCVVSFADPVITDQLDLGAWDPEQRLWRK